MIAKLNEEKTSIIIEIEIPPLDAIQPSGSGESLFIVPYQKWVKIKDTPFLMNIQVIAPPGWNSPELTDDQRFVELGFRDWKKEYGGF